MRAMGLPGRAILGTGHTVRFVVLSLCVLLLLRFGVSQLSWFAADQLGWDFEGRYALSDPDWTTQPAGAEPVRVANSLGMTLVLVPAGRFVMGSPPEEEGRANDERSHRLRITQPFYLATHETTVAQFRRFVDETGYQTEPEYARVPGHGWSATHPEGFRGREYSWCNPGFPQTDEHPVVGVTWNDAQAFCRWLSRKEGSEYRLPTEAEWEYACRAGKTGPFSTTSPIVPRLLLNARDSNSTESKLGLPRDDGFRWTAPIGSFPPNPLGLYDMHGNVMEWCEDWYRKDYYAESETDDPKGPESGKGRVVRGGSWFDRAAMARSANRAMSPPIFSLFNLGFRVVRPCPEM